MRSVVAAFVKPAESFDDEAGLEELNSQSQIVSSSGTRQPYSRQYSVATFKHYFCEVSPEMRGCSDSKIMLKKWIEV